MNYTTEHLHMLHSPSWKSCSRYPCKMNPSMDALPANRTLPTSCSHDTYQHKAITSRSHQLLMMVTWLPETCWATIRREIKNTKSDIVSRTPSMDALPTNRTWPPSCSHDTYQHKAITSRSLQLLMMGTWLPETCWATIRREIKNTKSDI